MRTYSFPTDNWCSIAGRKFEKTRQFSIAEAGFDLDIIETDEEEKVRLAFCQLALGYQFRNSKLLAEALNICCDANMRLAQIGDEVQGLLLCEEAYWSGVLTNGKAKSCTSIPLVTDFNFIGEIEHNVKQIVGNNNYQTYVAYEHGLDNYMYLRKVSLPGHHEDHNSKRTTKGPRYKTRIEVRSKCVADTLEAILGAVYLDSGSAWRENCLQVMAKFKLDMKACITAQVFKEETPLTYITHIACMKKLAKEINPAGY